METEKKKKQDGSAPCRQRAPTSRQNDGANTQKQAAYVAFKSLRNLTKGPKLSEAGGR